MPDIRHELLIAASAETVYHALTTQEGLSAWWTPQTITGEGFFRFSFGSDYYKEMTVTALKPAALVQWDCVAGFSEWVGTNIVFSLFPDNRKSLLQAHPEAAGQIEQQRKENGTLLKFEHNNWREYSAMYAECNYTWGQFLRSLKLFCETGKGKPWPDQHVN